MALADVLAVMDLGRIVQFGPAHELYNRPADVFVARLLGPTNLLQGQVESPAGDLRGEVIVRTPLGRLIAQSGPGAAGTGIARHDLGPSREPGGVLDGPGRLEPLPGDGRADRLPGRLRQIQRAGRATGRS